jgi:hypothetical protein
MIDSVAVLGKLADYSLRLGIFDKVNRHEPKSAPGNGVNTAIWLDEFETVESSGLSMTSMRLAYQQRIYLPMLSEPQDAIDPAVHAATQKVMNAYSTGFSLEGTARQVDLFGAYGDKLRAKAGYINQDSKLFRAMVITLPLIIDDVFDQEA